MLKSAGSVIRGWCGRRDSNPHGFPLGPKPSASTNFATPARTLGKCAAYNSPHRFGNPKRQATCCSQARSGGRRAIHATTARTQRTADDSGATDPRALAARSADRAAARNPYAQSRYRRTFAAFTGDQSYARADLASRLSSSFETPLGLRSAAPQDEQRRCPLVLRRD